MLYEILEKLGFGWTVIAEDRHWIYMENVYTGKRKQKRKSAPGVPAKDDRWT